MRRQDARDMFDEFGIDLPEGWLSEDDDVAFAGDGTKSKTKRVQVCHSCGAPVTTNKFCSDCGHSTCVKCTTSPLNDADDVTVIAHSYEGHLEIPNTKRQASSNQGPSIPSSRVGGESSVKTPLDRIPVAVKNNPFVIADQTTKANVVKPKMTDTAARARKPARLSDCVPNQREPSAQRTYIEPGHGTNHLPGSSLAQHTSQHDFEHSAHREQSTHAKLVAKNAAQGDPFLDTETEEPHCQSMNSLDKKIDQLYHHAEDLYHAQHIMEHLAAGSAAMEPRRSVSARPARRLSYSPASSRETSSISPSALRPAPHSISTDALARVNTMKKTHTMGKDPLSRIREQERPHAHSLSADAKGGKKQGPISVAAPKARLSDPPAWLASPEKQAGDAKLQLKKTDTNLDSKPASTLESSPQYHDASRRLNTSLNTAEAIANAEPWPSLKPVVKEEKPVQEDHRHSVLWDHVPLRRLTKTDDTASKAEGRPSSPAFRHHQLRKVTYPEAGKPEAERAPGVPKPDCTTCSVKGATASDELESDHEEMPLRQEDPDELFLPYRSTVGSSKKTLTVAEVEQVLASESSLRMASPPSERGKSMEIYSPVPIMPPNHSCSWRERYLALTAEVRHLKAEASSREAAVDRVVGEDTTQVGDVEAGVDQQRDDAGMGVEGLTIVVHMTGKDDLVINTDLRGVSHGQELP
ncbi:hypothetical protein ACHAQH_007556 [Verticillium albo-atrum]